MEECSFIFYNIGRVDGCEEAYLIERIVFLFRVELHHLNGFHGKYALVLLTTHLEDSPEAATAQLLDDFELMHVLDEFQIEEYN